MIEKVWLFLNSYLLHDRRYRAFWRFHHAFIEATRQGVIIKAEIAFHDDFDALMKALKEAIENKDAA